MINIDELIRVMKKQGIDPKTLVEKLEETPLGKILEAMRPR